MQYRRFTVFSDQLRCFDGDDKLLGSRSLNPDEITALVTEVEKAYGAPLPPSQKAAQYATLGKTLFDWLDGATERWLSDLENDSLALHIDVGERLRHLPWELLHDGTTYLCSRALQPVTPIRRFGKAKRTVLPQNRPLRVLFMASSPFDVRPVLSFEQEESTVLKATQRQPIELMVEETGSLAGLSERFVSVPEEDIFDVVHLTGHAGMIGSTPCFHLEDEHGMRHDATAPEIAAAFGDRRPRLLFLSGCWTGASPEEGALPSLCEALIRAGFPAVLGWALPVGDYDATVAAGELYQRLAAGMALEEAVARTRQKLWEAKSNYWHLLRFFTDATPPVSLVTRRDTRGRRPVHGRSTHKAFLDSGAKKEVCSREDFVGRRRELQRCLAVLRSYAGEPQHGEGVLLHNMGGLGKSSLALRLCERMDSHERIVLVGQIDDTGFLASVTNVLASPEVIATLNQPGLNLAQRLQNLLQGPLANHPVLFVFDDFEQNLDQDNSGAYRVQAEALTILSAVLAAIHTTESRSRVIVTCRYEFPLPGPGKLVHEGLTALRDADLTKKLEQFPAYGKAEQSLAGRALALAGGNPRLLKMLADVLGDAALDHDAILTELENVSDRFRVEVVLVEQILDTQPRELKQLLARIAVCNLPIDTATVKAIATPANPESHLAQAVAVSLCERGIDPAKRVPLYYVSPVVRPVLEGWLLDSDRRVAAGAAARHLFENGWKTGEWTTEAESLELINLALYAGDTAIASVVGAKTANDWNFTNRYRKTETLCERILTHGGDYRIHLQLARVQEVLGKTDKAGINYDSALTLCPQGDKSELSRILIYSSNLLKTKGEIKSAIQRMTASASLLNELNDVQGKAANLHEMAGLIARQGDFTEATTLYQDSLKLKEQIGDIHGRAVTLFELAGLADHQGDIVEAMRLCQEALKLYLQVGDVRGKAATLHRFAGLTAQQGDITEAIRIYQEAAKILEYIGDANGIAVTLFELAGLFAQQGDIAEAIRIYELVIPVQDQIGDVQGKATSLANVGYLMHNSGNLLMARQKTLESVRALVELRAYTDLAIPLYNLSFFDSENSVSYLAQAFWICTSEQIRLEHSVSISSGLVRAIGLERAEALPVAAAIRWLTKIQGREHPEFEQLRQNALYPLSLCAEARSVAPERFMDWLVSEGLHDPNVFFPRLIAVLREYIGDSWVFDPADLPNPFGYANTIGGAEERTEERKSQ